MRRTPSCREWTPTGRAGWTGMSPTPSAVVSRRMRTSGSSACSRASDWPCMVGLGAHPSATLRPTCRNESMVILHGHQDVAGTQVLTPWQVLRLAHSAVGRAQLPCGHTLRSGPSAESSSHWWNVAIGSHHRWMGWDGRAHAWRTDRIDLSAPHGHLSSTRQRERAAPRIPRSPDSQCRVLARHSVPSPLAAAAGSKTRRTDPAAINCDPPPPSFHRCSARQRTGLSHPPDTSVKPFSGC